MEMMMLVAGDGEDDDGGGDNASAAMGNDEGDLGDGDHDRNNDDTVEFPPKSPKWKS